MRPERALALALWLLTPVAGVRAVQFYLRSGRGRGGWMAHLRDHVAREIYIDRDLTHWRR